MLSRKKMKENLKSILNFILSTISYFIPKNKNRVFFKSKPDYAGNGKALSDYIYNKQMSYEIIWSLGNCYFDKKDKYYFKCVRKGTIKELYYYFTSKIVVTTHNEMIGASSKNQVYISLWHGMPFKKIGYLGEFDYIGMKDYSATRIATSEIMRSIISASFREKANEIYVTGQPRNDFLFKPLKIEELGLNISRQKKILLYAPTFRINDENIKYSDGDCISDDNFLRVKDFSIKELDLFLLKNDYHLILKLHPYEENYFKNIESLTSNITIIKTNTLLNHNIDVNQLLAIADILITDYSSMFFDYLILNRPIVFLVPDVANYRKSRGGFTLEPFDFWTPGHKVENQTSLLEVLLILQKANDPYKDKRMQVNSLINYYNDDQNSKRVVELMNSKLL
ncbi:hypothetical protein HII27_05770 [Kluyvera sp. SCKS090646]|uniref:Teichoic acid poly(glycerol phosphate) polymerase n=2 Tax=Kluyvera sichuanensis TaxID=2725494 RepID=A0ABR6RQ28_9ENTR|nr:hypothetical protein [Kluyvera sichuanensis]